MVDKIKLGSGQEASEREVMKWLKLAWKSAEREPFTIKEVMIIIVIVLCVINIIATVLI